MFSRNYLSEVVEIAESIDHRKIEDIVANLAMVRNAGGRVFVLGLGGSAGNASHLVNDLRKLCDIEAYAPSDNVSELTARTNDEGFDTIFSEYLKVSKLNECDAILILSVGGGSIEKKVSLPLVNAIKTAEDREATILAIVGSWDGLAAEAGHAVVVVPRVSLDRITPHAEEFQAVVWHCVVSHPELKRNATKW